MRNDAGADTRVLPWALPIFLFLVALNSFLVPSFLGWYDTGEMVGTTVCLGISHPSGQALYHLLGKLFLLIPWRTPAWRLGLMSVVLSALASCLFWRGGSRWVRALRGGIPLSDRLRGWIGVLTLCWSLSLPWWRYSLVPLVYALHLFLGLTLIWVLGLRRPGKWYLAALVLGVATVFRPTQFFAVPFVGLYFLWEWWREPRRSLSLPLRLLACFALGRSTALYFPLRSALGPELAYARITGFGEWFRQVFALKFSNYVGTVTFGSITHTLGQMAGHVWSDLTPFGCLLLLVGLSWSVRRRSRVPAFLWVALGWGTLEALFVLTIPYPTFESHQTLLGWAFSGWLACSALGWWEGTRTRSPWARFGVPLLLPAFLLAQLANGPSLWEKKKERGAEDFARDLLTILDPHALFVPTEENEFFPVVGYQQSFGFRKDVEVLEPGTPPDQVRPRIEEALRRGRALYVTRPWALPSGWSFSNWGPLLKVVPSTPLASAKARPGKALARWGGMDLMGIDLFPERVKAGGILEIRYHWVRRRASPQDRTGLVMALFVDPHGGYWTRDGVFWLHDLHEPSWGNPSALPPGRALEERRILFIPSDFPPGDYALSIGLQRSAPARTEGREAYDREFYERASAQDLDKFMGRGQGGAVVQFSMDGSGGWKDSLWPVTESLYPIADPRFVPAAVLTIEPND